MAALGLEEEQARGVAPHQPQEAPRDRGVGGAQWANRELATFGVWIKLAADVRMQRKQARDGHLHLEHWDRWAMQEERFFVRERPDQRADAVVDGLTGQLVV